VKRAIDALPSLNSYHQLLPYLIVLLVVAAVQAIFRFGWRHSLFGVSRQIEYEIRNDLFGHLQTLDRSFFMRCPIGDLMSRCTNDLVAVQEFIAYIGLVVVDSGLIIAMALTLMIVIDPLLTLGAVIPLPLLSIVFFHFGRRVREHSEQVQESLAHLTHVVQESLAGIRVIQAYTLETTRKGVYEESTGQYIKRNVELAKIRGTFYAALTLIAGLAAVIALWVGGNRVINGQLTLGGFVAFNSYLIMLTWPMMSVGFMVNLIQRGRASLDRIDRIFQQRPRIEDPQKPVRLNPHINHLALVGICFRYPGSDRPVLKDISLHIPAGSKVGITGQVGSGKTTLLALIPRIFDPTDGIISIDGEDLRRLPLHDLRRQVTLVAQEPYLFSDTILENIRFPTPDGSHEEVVRKARLVCLDKDEDAFPQGWNTLIGERGVMVSGGQRQRIALARALMGSPRILLLDDAFAHLDEETESAVLDNLLEALPESTILFTSHRISSLWRADRIVVLDGGRLVQEGRAEMLVRTPGYFRMLWKQQELLRTLDQYLGETHVDRNR
jgi:ATP-binding cassette subfamily B multidrug efflux pump